jgi:hypothetical protein
MKDLLTAQDAKKGREGRRERRIAFLCELCASFAIFAVKWFVLPRDGDDGLRREAEEKMHPSLREHEAA